MHIYLCLVFDSLVLAATKNALLSLLSPHVGNVYISKQVEEIYFFSLFKAHLPLESQQDHWPKDKTLIAKDLDEVITGKIQVLQKRQVLCLNRQGLPGQNTFSSVVLITAKCAIINTHSLYVQFLASTRWRATGQGFLCYSSMWFPQYPEQGLQEGCVE